MRPGAVRQWVAGEQVSLTRVVTRPDAVFDGRLHHHPHEQWLVMLAGELRLEIDGERFDVTTGDLVLFQPHTVHGAVGVGSEGAEYYEWFAPARYDGLPGYVGRSPPTWKERA
ncbi:MAG: cupin domain-containing protein [Actinobacteria bacterium]|nr:cupin domain-containing protein [Actinomycetota bacterium]